MFFISKVTLSLSGTCSRFNVSVWSSRLSGRFLFKFRSTDIASRGYVHFRQVYKRIVYNVRMNEWMNECHNEWNGALPHTHTARGIYITCRTVETRAAWFPNLMKFYYHNSCCRHRTGRWAHMENYSRFHSPRALCSVFTQYRINPQTGLVDKKAAIPIRPPIPQKRI